MAKKFKKYKKTIDINGESLKKYIDSLDNKLNQKERIDSVKSLLIEKEFTNEYGKCELLNKFLLEALTMEVEGLPIVNVNLTTSSNLSDEETFFVQLQRFANYILYAPDAERIDKKVKYNFYTESQFNKLINKEQPLSEIGTADMSDGEVIDFLVRKTPNFKKEKKINKIPISWLKDEELYPLIPYQEGIDKITLEMKKLKEILQNFEKLEEKDKNLAILKMSKYKIVRDSLYQDELDLYNIIKRPIYLKQVMSDSTVIDWTEFDFTNPIQIKALLSIPKDMVYEDYRDSLISDLYRYVKKSKLSIWELEVIDLLQKNYSLTSIGQTYNIPITTVFNRIECLIEKIILSYNIDHENWYYTHIEKGNYKKCDKCEEVILISKFRQNNFCSSCEKIKETKICTRCGEDKELDMFSPDSSKKDGHSSRCKECQKEHKKQLKLEKMMKDAGIL